MPNAIKKRLADLLDHDLFMPRELSWLSFNARVLQEAADDSVPVIERLRYLGIYSNNADEFFRVRVAEVRRLMSVSSGELKQQSKDLLVAIQKRVLELQKEFDRVYIEIMHELAKHRIYLINETQLDEGQAAFVRNYFTSKVLPELEPILLREEFKIPVLTDESIYLAVDISSGVTFHSAVVEVPTDRLSRFVEIPRRKVKGANKGSKVFIVLDNIIRACLPQVFRGVFPISAAEAYCFKFSRDAELAIDTGITQSLIDKMAISLKQRRKAETVRMVYDGQMPQRLLDQLCSRFGFGKQNTLIAGGRYHNSKDFMNFPNVGSKFLEFKKLSPTRIAHVDEHSGIFETIRKKDVFLYFPYHRFGSVIDLLKTAALDPHVIRIKICLYRVARDSRVIDALVNAVQNGKKVLAVVELAARFDEAANINWAQRLTENGIDVVFGIPGLKVHSKLLLIERREDHAIRYYSYISNGNFNEKTAKQYTDFSLVTYDQTIGKDVNNVFEFLQYNYKRPNFRLLLVSPHSIRSGILDLINNEIANAREGYRASMILKCNNLVDKELVMKLYEASQAGVKIQLIVRGMCSLLAGVKELSENIQAISIVDRYLEHARAYVFYNRGAPRYLIGSADLMTRNLDFRVEVLCPMLHEDAKRTIQDILDQQWHDNVKARVLDRNQSNKYVQAKKKGYENPLPGEHSQLFRNRKVASLSKVKNEPASAPAAPGNRITVCCAEGRECTLRDPKVSATRQRSAPEPQFIWRRHMIAYTTIGTADIEKAKAFYLAVLQDMGVTVFMDIGRLAALGSPAGGPMLAVCTPYNGEAPTPGNGNMVAISPGSTELVDKLHAKALQFGGTDEGAPGPRMDGFYGGYIRDPDGNKICFCHFG